MVGDGMQIDLFDVACRTNTEILLVEVRKISVQFRRKDAFSTSRCECLMESSQTGEKVNKSQVPHHTAIRKPQTLNY